MYYSILYPYTGRNTYYKYEYLSKNTIFTIKTYSYMCRDITNIDSLAKYIERNIKRWFFEF
jgi:hypothetical protein